MNQLETLFNNTLYHVDLVSNYRVDKNWSKCSNFYPYNRIYLILDGEAEITLKSKTITLEPGYLYLIPSFQLVNATCNDSMYHYYLHFQANTIIHNFFDYCGIATKVKADENSLELFKSLEKIYEDPSPESKLLTDGYFKILFSKFFTQSSFSNEEIMRLAPVLDYIETHIYEHIEVSHLAKLMNYTPIYFIHLFKSLLNVSPLQYILTKKLNIAQLMLNQNDLSVKEVAFKLGFENETYFSRVFVKKCGISPSEFKKKSISTNNFEKTKKKKK